MLLSVLLVVCSGLMNAGWNFFAKKSCDKSVFLGSIMIVPTLVLTPHLIAELSGRVLPGAAYVLMASSIGLQCCYSFLLSRAYKAGDLSRMYPIMRGMGVVLIPLIGVFVLGERLSPWGWLGVGAIVSGIFMLSEWSPRAVREAAYEMRPVLTALLVGLCITSYTVVDKMTLQYLSPLSLLQITNIGFLLGHATQMLDFRRVRAEWRRNGSFLLLGSVLSPGSYLLFLFAMDMAPVSHIAPVREFGTVFTALLGVFLLKEKHGPKRIANAAVIAFGIALIGIRG